MRVAVNFSNSTYISTLPFIYALTVNLQKILYNSQRSVGGRQYTIILFISIIFLPTILIYLNDKERGRHYLLQNFSAPSCHPPPLPQRHKYLFILVTERGCTIIFCRILTPPQCPPHTPPTPQYLFILMTERGRHYLLQNFSAPSMPPPPTLQYLFILMTERGGTIIFCSIQRLPNAPPTHSPDATIFIYLNDREDAPLSFVGFQRPQCPSPPPTTSQYLTILMTERGGALMFCRILTPPPPPSPDVTILNNLNDRELEGAPLFFVGFWRPPMPAPLPRRHNT